MLFRGPVRGKRDSGGVNQLVERRPQDRMDSMTRGSNPILSTRKSCEFFRVEDVVPSHCKCVQPPCVYARIRMITYAR